VVAATSACAASSTTTKEHTVTTLPPRPTRGSPQPLGPCQPVPAPAAAGPDWLPADLTLPSGSYPVRTGPAEAGASTFVFVVPTTPDDFSTYTLATWPAAGWRLHRPESEGFEGENRFTRGTGFGGFKVRAVYCDKAKSELTIAYAPGSG
jgi:hypothetical protein